MTKRSSTICRAYLKSFREVVGAKKDERIDKRYSSFLAPNDIMYSDAHCGHCAEVDFLTDIYNK